MKKIFFLIIGALTIHGMLTAQTFNVQQGQVTYKFPAEQTGQMTYSNGTALTVMDKTFTLADVTSMYVDESSVVDNTVNVAYSGSSILRLDSREGDMSRRQLCYDLKGLSFREFLSFEGVKSLAPVSLEDLLANHREIAAEIVSGIKIIALFAKYNEYGYYPFYKESPSGYDQRIIECVNKVIECDLPIVEDVTPATIRKTGSA